METYTIVQPNAKGQIVIPKKIRKSLGITKDVLLQLILRGRGIYLYPIDEVLTSQAKENSLVRLLEKTQGAWGQDDWEKTSQKRKKIELEASTQRKRPW